MGKIYGKNGIILAEFLDDSGYTYLDNTKVLKAHKPKAWGYHGWTLAECDDCWGYNDYTLLKELPNKKYIWIDTDYATGCGTDHCLCSNSIEYIGRDCDEVLNEIGCKNYKSRS